MKTTSWSPQSTSKVNIKHTNLLWASNQVAGILISNILEEAKKYLSGLPKPCKGRGYCLIGITHRESIYLFFSFFSDWCQVFEQTVLMYLANVTWTKRSNCWLKTNFGEGGGGGLFPRWKLPKRHLDGLVFTTASCWLSVSIVPFPSAKSLLWMTSSVPLPSPAPLKRHPLITLGRWENWLPSVKSWLTPTFGVRR